MHSLPEDSRQAMAQEQKELIEALLCGAPHPRGFDSERLQTASEALIRKRIRCMQRANSAVEEFCSNEDKSGTSELHRFIRANPSANPRGPYYDSLDFLAYVGKADLATAHSKNWKAKLLEKLRRFSQK